VIYLLQFVFLLNMIISLLHVNYSFILWTYVVAIVVLLFHLECSIIAETYNCHHLVKTCIHMHLNLFYMA
jgi:hypothetical protein